MFTNSFTRCDKLSSTYNFLQFLIFNSLFLARNRCSCTAKAYFCACQLHELPCGTYAENDAYNSDICNVAKHHTRTSGDEANSAIVCTIFHNRHTHCLDSSHQTSASVVKSRVWWEVFRKRAGKTRYHYSDCPSSVDEMFVLLRGSARYHHPEDLVEVQCPRDPVQLSNSEVVVLRSLKHLMRNPQ